MFAPFSNIYTPQYCTITSHVEDTSLSNVPSLKEALFKSTVDTTVQDIKQGKVHNKDDIKLVKMQ